VFISGINRVKLASSAVMEGKIDMPTYEYTCAACGHDFERFESITARPNKLCPKCNKKKAERRISAGGGFLFKGSGFYITDYKKSASAPAKDSKPAESKPAESCPCGEKPAAACDAKSKSESKPESKSSGKSSKPKVA